MPLTINTNTAAATASQNLSRNNTSLQKSLVRLSTGFRINKSSDDAGGLAVSMKLNASANRLRGVQNNIQNAISFLEVQDGVLKGSADILGRMGELKSSESGRIEELCGHRELQRGVQEPAGATLPNGEREVQRYQFVRD